jgi:sortase A
VRRSFRISGTILAGAGLLAAAWALTVWQWQDPFTALYTLHQQKGLTTEYQRKEAAYRPTVSAEASVLQQERAIRRAARRYRLQLGIGDPVGRLRVPRLGLKATVVNGTDHTSLAKGPGRDPRTYVPGEGELIYIAGHRTTYGAPFAHIERLQRGNKFTIEVPYATFVYRVSKHVIVPANDVARLRSRGHEEVVLQACHPRFFATERYLVYARPLRVTPRGGATYAPGRGA